MYNENPCATLLTNIERMQHIQNVADCAFVPKQTSPHYDVVFADSQKLSFNPYNVDWEDLERRCVFWSKKLQLEQFAKTLKNHKELVKKYVDFIKNKKCKDSDFGSFYI